ncbi:MAG: hypothetical protein ACRDGI_03640 [Candidatus Limnocylindrales bacterium]
MRRSRFLFSGFLVLALAGCASSGSPAPSAFSSPTAPATSLPSQVSGLTAPPASTPPSTKPAPPSVAADWQPVADPAGASTAQLSKVIWTGSQFVAFGSLESGANAFVESADGITWHVQPGPAGGADVNGLAFSASGLVAVGSQGSDARSWFSLDGLSWSAAPITTALKPDHGTTLRMNAVTAARSGFIAVGEEDTACEIDCSSGRSVEAVVWSSTDGKTWKREPPSSSRSHAAMLAIVAGGPGFIAVGAAPDRITSSDVPEHGVVWTSVDGGSWSRVADASLFHAPVGTDQTFGDAISDVATNGTMIVAVGSVESQGDVISGLIWRSTDGRAWQRATGEDLLGGQLFGVSAVPGGFLATGPSGEDNCAGGVWASATGNDWRCAAHAGAFGEFGAYDAAASPTITVVVGIAASDAPLPAAIWTMAAH